MQKNVIIKYGFKKRGEESCYTFYFSFALVRAQEGASAPCSSSICGVWKLALIVAGTFNLLAACCCMYGWEKTRHRNNFSTTIYIKGTHGFPAQQSNLGWLQVSVSEGLGHAMNTGPSRWFQRVRVFQVEFPALCGVRLIQIYPLSTVKGTRLETYK